MDDKDKKPTPISEEALSLLLGQTFGGRPSDWRVVDAALDKVLADLSETEERVEALLQRIG
jgi:hypothetical protein